MKLQEKRTVNAELQTQKKQQIEQGINLAKKIDALRETQAKEESDLTLFRKQTIAQVQVEVDTKVRERDNLIAEIRLKTREKEELLKPLDAEWEKVNIANREVTEKITEILKKKHELEEGISLNIQRERENDQERIRLADERGRTTESLSSAETLKADAVKELMKARSESSLIIHRATEREEAVNVREQEVEQIENKFSAKESLLQKWHLDLQKREKKLKANQEVLFKSQSYLKKKV